MTKKKKLLLGVFIVVIAMIAVIFAVTFFRQPDNSQTTAPDISDPPQEVLEEVDNSSTAAELTTPDTMQSVIDANVQDLYTDDAGNLAPSYPSNLIPLYRVSNVGDSNDITTASGNPGWTAIYTSDATQEDVISFYENLMASSENYALTDNNGSAQISGTVDGCQITITITGNNPERTGISGACSVDIYIERVQ